MRAPFSAVRTALAAHSLPDLDPLTGLVDRQWFENAIVESEGGARRGPTAAGIIAVGVDDLQRINRVQGYDAGDGVLLQTAELLQAWSATDDVLARLGGDDFAVLLRADAGHLGRAAGALRALLERAGIPASLATAMPSRRGGLGGALRIAEHRVRSDQRASGPREQQASRIVEGSRTAIAVSTVHAQATGILMQWHDCSADNARRELAYQAHELGMPVAGLARLLIAVASGDPLPDVDDTSGIELDRAIRLAAHVEARAHATLTDVHGPARTPALPAPRGALDIQRQPDWRLSHPNAASGPLSLSPTPALPTGPLTGPLTNLELAGRYQAAVGRQGSGGDWFDAFRLTDGTAALVVGDVAGHDALSAATMMQLRTLLRTLAIGREVTPSEVLQRLDRSLAQLDLGLLATACFGWVYTEPTGEVVLHWSNAGHLPPVLLTSDGATTVLECNNDLLLGLSPDEERADLSLRLPAGSTLLLFSDGLVETRTADLDVGLERLCAAAGPLARVDVAELCDTLVAAMVDSRAPDDVTILATRTP